MHAIRQHAFGPADVLRYELLPDPVPADGQVRIAAQACGVHVIDTAIRRGVQTGAYPLPDLPMVPGREVAGTVDAVGPGVDARWVGRRVVAHLGMAGGGYAELAVADLAALHEIPDGLAAEVAVAAIGTGRTAVGILEVAALTATDVVLVTAAAGGLGLLFVQAARLAGATVVGAAGGPAKVRRVLDQGADLAVDYLRPDWPAEVRRALGGRAVTVVLDGVGGAAGRAALELLDAGGRLVFFGWSSGEPLALTTQDLYRLGISAAAGIGPRLLRRPGGLGALETAALGEAAAGTLVPVVGQTFPLAEAAAAHTAIETRGTVGKVVLVP
jgi:NADPH2:quinone reductase